MQRKPLLHAGPRTCLTALPALAFSLVISLFGTASAFAQMGEAACKMIVPFAAGGPADQIARIIVAPLGAQLGRPVLIDNRGGAGGVIGVGLAAKAPADGMTLLLTTSSYVITAGTTPRLPYNPRKDFEPLYLLGEVQTCWPCGPRWASIPWPNW